MKTDFDRLVSAIARALRTAGLTVCLDGHTPPDSARGASWVRISPMNVVRGDRNTRADAFVSLSCFSTDTGGSFSHLGVADACIAALGKSLKLCEGETVVGIAQLSGRPKLTNLGEVNKTLQCVLDLDYIYNTQE